MRAKIAKGNVHVQKTCNVESKLCEVKDVCSNPFIHTVQCLKLLTSVR